MMPTPTLIRIVKDTDTNPKLYLDKRKTILRGRTISYKMESFHPAVAVQEMDSKPNRVLGARPPQVDKSVTALPRHWQSTLAQLRSGFCHCLRSYRAVVDQLGQSVCPECGADKHTVNHLFVCNPTTL